MDDDLRLLDVAIHRFRGFAGDRRPLRFGNVTVLVGANGHGKTSVFDAIDWAVFGDAWRWGKTTTDTDVTRGLRRPDQLPAVTLRFQSKSQHTLLRSGAKATWDGAAFEPSALCRNFSVFARSADLLRALRGITYLPQENLRALVASESEEQRQLMLAALAGVPFADRFEQNLRKTRDDLDLRRRTADKDMNQIRGRLMELEDRLKELRASHDLNREIFSRVGDFLGQATVDSGTAAESVSRRIQELRRAEHDAARKAQASKWLARELEESAVVQAETEAALGRASSERDEAKRLLTSAVEEERLFLQEQADRVDLLKKLGMAMEAARLSLQNAEQQRQRQLALAAARDAASASATRVEELKIAFAGKQQELDKAREASAAANAQLEEARSAFARATDRASLLTRRVEIERQVSELQQDRARSEAVLAAVAEEAKQALDRESRSRSKAAELRVRLQQSLDGAERVAQVIAELLSLQPSDDPKCLVCGHDHGAGDARASAMREQLREVAAVTELTKALASADAQLANDSTQSDGAKQREKDATARVSNVAEAQARVASELEAVRVRLSEYPDGQGTGLERVATALQESTKLANANKAAVEMAEQDLKVARRALDVELEAERRLTDEFGTLLNAAPERDEVIDDAVLGQRREAAADAASDWEAQRRAVEADAALQSTRALDIKRLRQQLSALEATVHAQRTERERLSERRAMLLRQVEDLGVKVSEGHAGVIPSLTAAAALFDADAGRARVMAASGDAVQTALATLTTSSQIEVVEEEIAEQTAALAAVTERGAGVEAAQRRLEEIAAAVNRAIADSMTGAIRSAQDRINEILSDLCPHQHLNVMRLAQDGVLFATDQAGSPTVRPEYYGSTGQLGCMGLAVFLGVALGQRWSRLNMLLLDEPVQNMDDVNFVRFLDLIRRLAETHQVVVSTADKNIGELLKRKLSLWADGHSKTAIIHRFEAFDVEVGPTIRSEELGTHLRAVGR